MHNAIIKNRSAYSQVLICQRLLQINVHAAAYRGRRPLKTATRDVVLQIETVAHLGAARLQHRGHIAQLSQLLLTFTRRPFRRKAHTKSLVLIALTFTIALGQEKTGQREYPFLKYSSGDTPRGRAIWVLDLTNPPTKIPKGVNNVSRWGAVSLLAPRLGDSSPRKH